MHTPPVINRKIILLTVALSLAGLFALDSLHNTYIGIKDDFRETQASVKRLRLMVEQPQNWSDYLQESIEQTLLLEEKFMGSTSYDLAQANIQSWLQKLLGKSTIRRPDVIVDTTPELQYVAENAYPYWRINAAISGRSEQAVALGLLNELENHGQWFVEITSLAIAKDRFLINLSVIALEQDS